MIRRGILLGMVAALAALSSAPAAQAAFGFEKLDMTFENADGTLVPPGRRPSFPDEHHDRLQHQVQLNAGH